MAFGYDPTTIVLTPEEEDAARQAAQGTTPPPAPPASVSPPPVVSTPYDPAQDTQGQQAQPNTLVANPNAGAAPIAVDEYSSYNAAPQPAYVDTGTAPPESAQQTVTEPAPVAPPPYTPPVHPFDDWHQYGAPPTNTPRTSVLGPLQTPADLLWKAIDARFHVGDPIQRYQDAEEGYARGQEPPPLRKAGEGWAQTLVDLEHSGLGQFLGNAYGDAQARNTAIAKGLATPAGLDTSGAPDQPSYVPTDRTQAGDFVPRSPSEAGPLADLLPPPRYFMPAPTGKNIVTTSYPAEGTTTVQTKAGAVKPYYPIQVGQTYRSIPPAGSTYPARETAYGFQPRDQVRIQAAYDRGLYPDVEPRFQGEGPLGEGPPTPTHRQIPWDTFNRLLQPFWRGEGNMGYHDPLADPEMVLNRPVPGAGNYTPGMGETTPETTWRPGFGSPYTPEQEAVHRARLTEAGHPELLPPPGYVPEMWKAKGDTLSSYWLEKGAEPEQIPVPQHVSQGQTPPPEPPSRLFMLAELDRRRRERGLRGLFGGR